MSDILFTISVSTLDTHLVMKFMSTIQGNCTAVFNIEQARQLRDLISNSIKEIESKDITSEL